MTATRSSFDDDAATRRRTTELQLLEGVLRGERGSERAFVERFVPLIRNCVRKVTGGRASGPDLEDLLGEVWLCLWEDDKRRLRRFDARRGVLVSTWITALARNRSIDYLRTLRRDPTPVAVDDDQRIDEAPLASDVLEQRERVELARRAIARLSDDERAFLFALCVEEDGPEAIAAQLGISLSTVYTRRFKLGAKLARLTRRAEVRCAA